MEKNSTEFDYSGKADTKREIKRSGPSWLLLILIIAVSTIGIIVFGLEWLSQ